MPIINWCGKFFFIHAIGMMKWMGKQPKIKQNEEGEENEFIYGYGRDLVPHRGHVWRVPPYMLRKKRLKNVGIFFMGKT